MTEAPPTNRDTVDSIKGNLANKAWRMNNIYLILNEDKVLVRYTLRDEQRRFYRERHTRNFVPKSRKYGISTAVVLDYLDDCIWAPPLNPVHAAHVDFRDPDAKEKLQIARCAWENGPNHPDPAIAAIWRALHERNPLITDNTGELKWKNGSKQQASTSFMGGNPTRLHISEFGPLAAQYPDRATKVMRGTVNSAPTYAVIDMETTMEGGTFGECAAVFDQALQNEERRQVLNPLEWRMFFIPWWKHPSYVLPGCVPQLETTREYFRNIFVSDGLTIPLDRQAWYESKKKEQRHNMFTQYPTVVRECLYAGDGAAFFDPDALLWQNNQITGLETDIQYGEIVVQGDVLNFAARSAGWARRPQETGWLMVMEHPLPGRRYLLFADCGVGKQAKGSDDTKRDTHSYGVLRDYYIDPESGRHFLPQVVAMCQGDDPHDKTRLTGDRCPTVEFIRRVVALSIYYGNCMTVPEINNKDDIAPRLVAAGVKNMYVQGMVGDDGAMAGTKHSEKVYGWLTNESTRRQMLENMQMMTMQQQWICTFRAILQQMGVFVINKTGRPEAAPGEHDDHVIGPGIGLFNLRHATLFLSPQQVIGVRYRNAYEEHFHDPRGI